MIAQRCGRAEEPIYMYTPACPKFLIMLAALFTRQTMSSQILGRAGRAGAPGHEITNEAVLYCRFFILTSWHCLHSALSARVAYKAYKIEPLLNPFSSGILS